MSPLLIFASVPTSNTGVFPETFFSSRGPSFGLFSPSLSVSPIMKCDAKSKSLSTTRTGNHLSSHIDNPKVDLPSISCGNTCNWKVSLHKFKVVSRWKMGHKSRLKVEIFHICSLESFQQ